MPTQMPSACLELLHLTEGTRQEPATDVNLPLRLAYPAKFWLLKVWRAGAACEGLVKLKKTTAMIIAAISVRAMVDLMKPFMSGTPINNEI